MIVRNQNPVPHGNCSAQRAVWHLRAWVMWVIAVSMSLTFALHAATPQSPVILNGPTDMATLSKHITYILDPSLQLRARDFVDPSTVVTQPLSATVPDFGYTAAKIWLRLPVIQGGAQATAWRFHVHANFMQEIAIYKMGPEGSIVTLLDLKGDSPFEARPINDPQMAVPFDLREREAATLLIGYYSQGASRLSMSIETPDSYARAASVSQAKSYAFYGMMLVMIVLVSAALAVLRQAVFAVFAGYLIFMLLYISHSDGVAFQYLWSDFPRFNSMASVVMGSGVIVFGGLFAMLILQTARFHPTMHRVLIAAVSSVVVANLVLWSSDPQLLKRLLTVMLSVCTLTYLVAGLIAARTRFREVRFYVLAWIAVFVPASLFTARFAFGLESTFITLYDTIRIALVFESLLMGLAIFDRYNQLRQSAVEENLAQVQASLALSQRLATLEGNYAQVKHNARRHEENMQDTVHDLRQPMQALRLSLRQLVNPQAGSQSGVAADAGHIDAALSYMERLVAERLDNPTHATPSVEPNASPGIPRASEPGLHGVLCGVADMFAAEAAAKGLALRVVLAAPDAPVDAYALMRAVTNLVSNAIKYTQQGRILISLRRHGAGHFVEVHDTGPGLAGAAFEQALLRCQRLDRDRDAAAGSGLGLSLVKEIAETANWKISACEARRTGASIRLAVHGS